MKKTLVKLIGYIFFIPTFLIVGVLFCWIKLFNILEEAFDFAARKVDDIFYDFSAKKSKSKALTESSSPR